MRVNTAAEFFAQAVIFCQFFSQRVFLYFKNSTATGRSSGKIVAGFPFQQTVCGGCSFTQLIKLLYYLSLDVIFHPARASYREMLSDSYREVKGLGNK